MKLLDLFGTITWLLLSSHLATADQIAISCGHADNQKFDYGKKWKFAVGQDFTVGHEESGWTYKWTFWAYDEEMPDTKPISIWWTANEGEYRWKISEGHSSGTSSGWTHEANLWVTDTQKEGHTYFKVKKAAVKPARYMIVSEDREDEFTGWTDQDWGFWATTFEDYVVSLDFDLDLGTITQESPLVVSQQTLPNESTMDQSITFSFTDVVTHTSSFGNEVGASLTVGSEFSASIPFVGDSTISVSLTASYAHTWGEELSFTKTYQAYFPLQAAPNTVATCKASVSMATLEVPYHITFYSGRTLEGMWTGVTSYNLHAEYDDEPLR